MPTFNAKVLCHAVVKVNDGVDPIEFIKNNNEYIVEPKNADGCIVAFKPKEVNILKRGELTDDKLSDKLDQFIHFSFRGSLICVDTINRTVISSGKAKPEEMTGPKEKGYWPLNVETS